MQSVYLHDSPLSFTFIANACGIFTGKKGTRILSDPWIVDGVFEGSWCHCPPLETKFEDLEDVDAIYVSHLHPDHFDERYFDFRKDIPIIAMDHGPNFLLKKLDQLGFHNIIRIKNGETVAFNEFKLTMYAPFTKHAFHEAKIGNLIDSALVVECDGWTALNANDNTPTVEACEMLREKFGRIDFAMINYNAAGPYPSCFDNLSKDEKLEAHERVLDRNIGHMYDLYVALDARYILPFAGAYVIGGVHWRKNEYLGTTTWDRCAEKLVSLGMDKKRVVLLREKDTFCLKKGAADRKYIPVDTSEMQRYIESDLAQLTYPYEYDDPLETSELFSKCERASGAMLGRMDRFGIESDFKVVLEIDDQLAQIYPIFERLDEQEVSQLQKVLVCTMDVRLLNRILEREAHWNNAEIGAHISFFRSPDHYDPDLHTGLQFFHT